MCVRVYLFYSCLYFNLTWVLLKLIKFIIYFILLLFLVIFLKKWEFKIQKILKKAIQEKNKKSGERELNKDKTKL